MASGNVLALPSIFRRMSLEVADVPATEEVGQAELGSLFDRLVDLATDPSCVKDNTISYVCDSSGAEAIRYSTNKTISRRGLISFTDCDDYVTLVRREGVVVYHYEQHYHRGQLVPIGEVEGQITGALVRQYDAPGMWLRRQVLTPSVYAEHLATIEQETERRAQTRRSAFWVARLALREAGA